MDDIEYKMENSKLVSFLNGCLMLQEATLKAFVNRIDPSFESLPVAVLSIIGPPKSGKSFYSNLLIKYLEKRTDDWLTDLSSGDSLAEESLHGFSFGNVTCGNIVPPSAESGIYIWPEPFRIKTYGGKIIVCILHIHECITQNENTKTRNTLHTLLCLLCSRITQIKWRNNKYCDLEFDATASTTDSIVPKSIICRNFLNLYRIQQHPLVCTQIQDTVSTDCDTPGNVAECVKSCNDAYIDESHDPLHNEHGTLTITGSMHGQIDKGIKSIADSSNIFPKLDEDHKPLTASGIVKYFAFCVSKMNECVKNEEQKPQENPQICTEQFILVSEKTQMSDEQRKRDDETKFTKLVDAVLADLDVDLKDQLELWLKDKLNISTLMYCADMYKRSIRTVIESRKSYELSTKEMETVEEQIIEKSVLTKEKILGIEKIITDFHLYVESIMLKEVCINPDSMPQKLLYPIQDEDKYVKECAQIGCTKLASIYLLQNERIVDAETQLIVFTSQRFRKLYTKVMVKTTSNCYCSQKRIYDIHSHLASLCLKKFVATVLLGSRSGATSTFIVLSAEKELKDQLENEYETYRQSNLKWLESLQNKVLVVIGKHKTEYCSEMEKIIGESPNGIPLSTFKTQHNTVKESVLKNLKTEIGTEIAKTEPTKYYLLTMKYHIETFWTTFSRLNAERVNLPKTTHSIKHDVSCEAKVDLEQSNDLDTNKGVSYSAHSNESNSEPTKTPCKNTRLPPILFLFSLSEIRTYIHYKNELKLVGKFPTVVCATANNNLFYGNDVTGVTDHSKFDRVWRIGDYLFRGHEVNPPETLNIGNSVYFLNTEMLLGYILHSIKQKAEEMCKGFATECVITIPFWLTSTQRRRIKDSAKSAGFQNVYLVNENSAAALYYCQSTNDEGKNDIIMLSENSGCVDIAIFIYDPEHRTVKMTGYFYYYDSNHQVSSQLSIDQRLHLEKKVKEAYLVAQEMTNAKLSVLKLEFRARAKTVVISFQSGIWKDVLISVGKRLVKNNHLGGLNADLVLNGTYNFSKNSATNQNATKDWLSASIFRNIGTSKNKFLERIDCYLKAPNQFRFANDTFCLYNEDVIYYQKAITGQAIEIGRIHRTLYNNQCWTNVSLEISSENIVVLKHHSDKDSRTWNQLFFDEPQLANYLSLFESLEKLSENLHEKNSKKQELIEKGNILLEKVQNGKFRSELAKDMAMSQIKESLDVLNHPRITLDDIRTQLENLKKCEAKFCKI